MRVTIVPPEHVARPVDTGKGRGVSQERRAKGSAGAREGSPKRVGGDSG
jgi:hypothetical protein